MCITELSKIENYYTRKFPKLPASENCKSAKFQTLGASKNYPYYSTSDTE